MKLNGMNILVTGGMGKVGTAIVEEIERQGGIPLATSRSSDAVEEFNDQSIGGGKKARAVQLSFDQENKMCQTLTHITETYGPVHGLVNNAYASIPAKSVEDTTWSDWGYALQINVAAAHTLAVALAGHGSLKVVVNVASMYAVVAPNFRMYPPEENPNPVIYGPTKAALVSLTRYLAAYWGGRGIRVNAISPGGILDKQAEDFLMSYGAGVPSGRMLDRREIAATVCFLLGPDSSGINGHNLVVDGGRTIW